MGTQLITKNTNCYALFLWCVGDKLIAEPEEHNSIYQQEIVSFSSAHNRYTMDESRISKLSKQ